MKTVYTLLLILGLIAGFFCISEISMAATICCMIVYLTTTTAGILGLLKECDALPASCYVKKD